MATTKKQSLEQALHLARTGKSRSLSDAAGALHGLPVGDWPETRQAMMAVQDALPLRSQRSYTIEQWVAAAYARETHRGAADTYRAIIGADGSTECGARTDWGHVCEMESGHAGNHRYSASAESDVERAAALDAEEVR